MTQLFATLLRHSCLDGHFAHLLDDFCRLSLGDIPIVTEVSMFCLLSLDLKYGWQNENNTSPLKNGCAIITCNSHFNRLKGYIQFRWP